jgi:predicted DNA-binding protein with PD1-like motif
MKYRVGRPGRCFVVRLEDGDAVLDELTGLAKKEQIRAAVFYLVGGLKEGHIVVGPERDEMPPEPVWRTIDESHETLGVGTIFRQGDEPKIHFHGAYGKRDTVRVGCLRDLATTFIILEAIVMEIEGIEAERQLDPVTNMTLLAIE